MLGLLGGATDLSRVVMNNLYSNTITDWLSKTEGEKEVCNDSLKPTCTMYTCRETCQLTSFPFLVCSQEEAEGTSSRTSTSRPRAGGEDS